VTPSKESSSHPQEPHSSPDLQRLTALVQHQLNNPLAALLAEAQLLRTEPGLGPEQGAAVDRMIDIVRRIILLVRDLERSVAEKGKR
jgi:signal transduction histidine kinase